MAPEIISESYLNRFVVAAPELGVGRLVGIDDSTVRVRYFRGPAESPYVERLVDMSQVRFYRIRTHTRVYFHDGQLWRIGRIYDDHPNEHGRYLVELPNRTYQLLSSDEFDLRWTPVIEDPYEVLASLGGDSAYLYGPRIDLIAAWHSQKAAALGVEGLLLASVELHDHQLTVVRTVSSDPNRRYVLGAEDGPGKTVEAGALICQSLRAHPKSKVLVLAPDHLRQQWNGDLLDKFHIDEFTQAPIQIRANEKPETWPRGPVDILVIDEAHHLTRAGQSSPSVLKQVAALAHGSNAVFLLSAIPVRSNEAAFLDLLHLLDPQNYQPQDLDSFIERMTKQDQIDLLQRSLTPKISEFRFSRIAKQLRSKFPHDNALSRLIEQAASGTDEQRPDRIVRVKNYLSDASKLTNPLLRTRRTPQTIVSRGQPFPVEISDDSDELRYDLIEDFRHHVAELLDSGETEMVHATGALRMLGQACGSLPQAILELTDIEDESNEVSGLVARWLRSIGDEWKTTLASIAPDVLEETVSEITDIALPENNGKGIVATSYSAVAREVSEGIADFYETHLVAEHLRDHSHEENATSVDRWRFDPLCRILVCDSSAENVVNLQTADWIIHLDLPWDTLRLDRLLVRADGFGYNSLPPRESMVFLYGWQVYARGWFLFADDTCGVFDQPASSLQYVPGFLESDLLGQMITSGVSVFDSNIELRHEYLQAESEQIKDIENNAEFYSLNTYPDDINEELFYEDKDPQLGEALTVWLNGMGGHVNKLAKGIIKIALKPRLQIPFSLEQEIAPWIERELTFSRQTAVDRHIPIVRPGHGLLDKIVAHLRNDDLGTAFAFLRGVKNLWPPLAVFRTDFLVRPSQTGYLDQVARNRGLSSWLQIERSSLVSPVLETVLMSDAGAEMERPWKWSLYDKDARDRDLGRRPELFDELSTHFDWTAACSRGLAHAMDILSTRDSWQPRASRSAFSLRSLIDDRLAALRARQTALNPQLVDQEIQAFEALWAAVPDPLDMTIDVIGCGVIFLADADRILATLFPRDL